jgi:hypothetical protein
MPIARQAIIDAIHLAIADLPWAHAAWLGGSDATGRLDRFSDIDLVVAVDDDRIEEAFSVVRACLQTLSPIDLEWRVPSPTFHGHEQVFYRLRDADPHHMVDFVPMKLSAPPPTRFLDRERHGVPVVLFDRVDFCATVPMDQPSIEQRRRTRLERIRVTFPLLQPLVTRAVARGQPADAAYWYMQLTLLPTVEILRMLHAPDRFDFGMRYLYDDLPPEVYAQVCALVFPGSLHAVLDCRARAEAIFNRALAAFDASNDQA